MLTPNQIAAYHERGYITPEFRLPDELLEEIRDAHARLVARHAEFADYCSALLAYDTWYLTVARRPEILDMVQQVIGPDIALWNCSFFAKPAKIGTKTPWHQDGEYWPIRPLATCTVWIAVDASTTENGCLRVIPGSHRSRRLARHRDNDAPGLALHLELEETEFDESQAEDIVLAAGQVSLHDVYLYHGSEANRSEQPRRGLTLRYMPTTSVYQHDLSTRFRREGPMDMSQRTIYLMRGSDRSGANDFRMRR
jgi:ectoine hydroxylase-related dioxygenase (phytanoyl-CoA dioxygenase family)